MFNDWIMPTRSTMELVEKEVNEQQTKLLEVESKIEKLGIITRSKKVLFDRLQDELQEAHRRLNDRQNTKEQYKRNYEIIRTQTEQFGWRYPTWAQWPRDADIFHREAFNAYTAKRDIQAFGRAY